MQRIRIPRYLDEITPKWLTQTLRYSGTLDDRTSVRQISVSDPGREASYAGFVSRLIVEYDQADTTAPGSIIVKLPAPERFIRAIFQSIYRNEALFYRQLAGSGVGLMRVPVSYASLLNRRGTRSVLLLEDLSQIAVLGDHETGCTLAQAELALTRLAGMHAAWWDVSALDETSWLGHYRAKSPRNWLIYAGAWLPFQFRLRQITPPATLSLFRNLWRYRDRLLALEVDRPRTLQHGDFRLANLAFTDDDVVVFDWQVVRSGPPLFDVAWFMITSLTVEQRRTHEAPLLRAYHVALVGNGISRYAFEDLVHDYWHALLLIIPQIMVIGAFLRIDTQRREVLGLLLRRFDAARADHDLHRFVRG